MGMGIYAIKNKQNGNLYIGSAVNLANRYKNHFDKLNSNVHPNKHLQSAYNKYGKNNFEMDLLQFVYTPKDLIKYEQYWIDLAKNEESELYNTRLIAESNLGLKFGIETGLKHSKNKKGKLLKLFCDNGHSNIPENRYKYITGGSICRLCAVKDPSKHYPLKFCKRGHERTTENLYKNKTCKTCQRGN